MFKGVQTYFEVLMADLQNGTISMYIRFIFFRLGCFAILREILTFPLSCFPSLAVGVVYVCVRGAALNFLF